MGDFVVLSDKYVEWFQQRMHMLQCMAEVEEEWIWLVYRCSLFLGGVGGSSTFNVKQ